MATAKAVAAQLIFIANGKASTWTIQIACRRRRSTGRSKHFLESISRRLRSNTTSQVAEKLASRFLTIKRFGMTKNKESRGLVTHARFKNRFLNRVFHRREGMPLN